MVKRVLTSIITVAVLMGVLVACGGSDSELAELRAELEQTKSELAKQEAKQEDESNPVPTPETLSIEEKEYYRQICEDSLGVPPISWEGCSVAIEIASENISRPSDSSKQYILSRLTAWFECETVNRLKDPENVLSTHRYPRTSDLDFLLRTPNRRIRTTYIIDEIGFTGCGI